MRSTKNGPAKLALLTAATNRSLGEQGCNYCMQFRPADQVRRIYTATGRTKFICDHCEAKRKPPTKGPAT